MLRLRSNQGFLTVGNVKSTDVEWGDWQLFSSTGAAFAPKLAALAAMMKGEKFWDWRMSLSTINEQLYDIIYIYICMICVYAYVYTHLSLNIYIYILYGYNMCAPPPKPMFWHCCEGRQDRISSSICFYLPVLRLQGFLATILVVGWYYLPLL